MARSEAARWRRAQPDGYNYYIGYTGTLAIGPTSTATLATIRAPILRRPAIGTAPNTLVVHPSLPVHSVAELIAYAKANPGKLNYGRPTGTVSHVCGEYLVTAAGVKNHPHSLQGDRTGDHRPARRATFPWLCAPVPQRTRTPDRQAAHASGDQRGALDPGAAETCRPSRRPRCRLRGGAALWPGRAAGHAAGGHRLLNVPRSTARRSQGEEVRARLAIDGAEPLPSTPAQYADDIDREETQWSKVVKASGAMSTERHGVRPQRCVAAARRSR